MQWVSATFESQNFVSILLLELEYPNCNAIFRACSGTWRLSKSASWAIVALKFGNSDRTAGVSRQRGVANERRILFEEVARIGNVDLLRAAAGDLLNEGAEPRRQIEIGPQLCILLGADRGHVDGVGHHSAVEIAANLLGDANPDRLLRFFGGAADVGRGNDILVAQQRGGSRRLLGENVERGAANLAWEKSGTGYDFIEAGIWSAGFPP